MPTLQQALYYHVSTSLTSTRIYPSSLAPTSVDKPYVIYQRVDDVRHRQQDRTTGLSSSRYQFTIVADSELAAHNLRVVLRDALEGYRGDMGEAGLTVAVRGIFLEDDRDLPQTPSDSSEQPPHIVELDFLIWHVDS